MRRGLAGVVVILLSIPALSVAAGDTADYRDDFGGVSYSGSDGSIDWSSEPWSEDGTDDGEPGKGMIHVGQENCSNNQCLHMESGLFEVLRIRRAADLSDLETAQLSFDMYIEPPEVPLEESIQVQVRGNGQSWRSLGMYPFANYPGEHHKSYDVTAFAGSDFELRFRVAGLNTGGPLDGWVVLDRVTIEGTIATSSTTTSSSTSTTSSTSSTSTSSTTSTVPGKSSTSTSSSTTSTLAPTTSSTVRSTTTSRPTTTSTPRSTSEDVTTTTTIPQTTSTTGPEASTTTLGASFASELPPPPSGLRDPGVGLISDYESGMMGEMDMEQVEVLGADLNADFSLAVEVFEAARVWIAGLTLLVAAAIVSGMEKRLPRRRSD